MIPYKDEERKCEKLKTIIKQEEEQKAVARVSFS